MAFAAIFMKWVFAKNQFSSDASDDLYSVCYESFLMEFQMKQSFHTSRGNCVRHFQVKCQFHE